MNYQVTIRHGKKRKRYLILSVDASDVPSALRLASEAIPEDISPDIDLVEFRVAPDYEKALPDPSVG